MDLGKCRTFSKIWNNEVTKREILPVTAVTVVSVAFGVSIGGSLFSLDDVSYYFSSKYCGEHFSVIWSLL